MRTSPVAIAFSKVSVRRGAKDALAGVTLSIRAGEHVAILGPNGSGKSTLIKAINRELYATSGAVRLFGKETWDVFALRSKIGIVSYDVQAQFASEITGRDVVLSGFFNSIGLWKNNRVTPEMTRKADQAIRWLGLKDLANETMTHLSSGEARRFLIARALIHRPQLIVFDEPMNSLDLRGQALVKGSLRKLARAGVGIVLVTHHLSDIIPEIRRVIVLDRGRVVADGRKEDLLVPEMLRKLFSTAVRVTRHGGYYQAF